MHPEYGPSLSNHKQLPRISQQKTLFATFVLSYSDFGFCWRSISLSSHNLNNKDFLGKTKNRHSHCYSIAYSDRGNYFSLHDDFLFQNALSICTR